MANLFESRTNPFDPDFQVSEVVHALGFVLLGGTGVSTGLFLGSLLWYPSHAIEWGIVLACWIVCYECVRHVVIRAHDRHRFLKQEDPAMVVVLGFHPRVGEGSSLLHASQHAIWEPRLIPLVYGYAGLTIK
jgi:hypothetical protein